MINKFSNGGRVLVLAIFATFLASQAFAADFQKGPRIVTEKASYLASESVRINGEDFEGYERVRFAVGIETKEGTSGLVLGQWDVYADGKGRVATTWDLPSDGGSYVVTATGDVSGMTAKTTINSLLAESVKLAQCANSNANPQNLDCPSSGPAGWVTGLVGSSKALYFEGDFIAYRNVMEGLTPGDSYKWTVKYDVTKASLNAIDYLGTYNATISNANPCADGNNANGFCTQGGPTSTFPIPVDSKVTNGRDQVNGTSDDITQIPGFMSAWNGTITGVSQPVYSGPFPVGDESATVDITFTAGSSTVVLAWGGHISTRSDWGEPFGSVNITGAPYHTANGGLMNITAGTSCCGGSQDLQLQDSVVISTAKITIIKVAAPESSYAFGFTATNLNTSSFSLTDDGTGTADTKVFDGISLFGTKRITETDAGPYSLASIVCSTQAGSPSSTPNVGFGYVDITVGSGDEITCTFTNSFLTAAEAIVTGRVLDADGHPLAGAWVSGTDGNGNTRTAMTNQFGYYTLRELEAGTSLFMDVAHKSYNFASSFVTLNDEVTTVNFNGSPR
jgi:hypothetical protein